MPSQPPPGFVLDGPAPAAPAPVSADPAGPYRGPKAAADLQHTEAQTRNDATRLGLDANADQRAARKADREEAQARTKTLQSYGSAVSNIDKQISRIDQLSAHPGLDHITGPVEGRLPTLANDAIAGVEHWLGGRATASDPEGAQGLLDQIGSSAAIAELQDMRASSPTGGALGSVSNYEDQMLRNAVVRLRQSQSPADFRKSLSDYRTELLATKRRLHDAYANDYGEPPGQTAVTAPAAPAHSASQPRVIDFHDLPGG